MQRTEAQRQSQRSFFEMCYLYAASSAAVKPDEAAASGTSSFSLQGETLLRLLLGCHWLFQIVCHEACAWLHAAEDCMSTTCKAASPLIKSMLKAIAVLP